MGDKFLGRRIIIYTVGLFFYSLGIALSAKSDLGIAPVSTLPYALSFVLPFTFGVTTFFMTIIYILIQIVIFGRDFEKRQYFQILVGVLFSSFIDLSMILIRGINPVTYIERIILLIIGCFILSIGITLSVLPDVIIPPAEGAINALSKKLGIEFGNMKIIFDATIVLLAIVVSLFFIGYLVGFKEGTIISVFLTGIFTKYFIKLLGPKIEKMMGGKV